MTEPRSHEEYLLTHDQVQGVAEARQNLSHIVQDMKNQDTPPVFVGSHRSVSAVILPYSKWREMTKFVSDTKISLLVMDSIKEMEEDPNPPHPVPIDEFLAEMEQLRNGNPKQIP